MSMFSVVIPLYNKELSVQKTLQSVLNQSFVDFEIVIINDGSTDNSVEKVKQLKDNRIRLIHQKNKGVSAARNKGIEEAKYNWICFLDADDIWKENHLQEFVNMIKLFSDDKVFCTSHTKSKLKEEYEKKIINGYEVIEDYFDVVMKHVDFFWTGAVCIHKSVFKKVGEFPEGINRGEDLNLWNRIGALYSIMKSEKLTVLYNFESENKLTNRKLRFKDSGVSLINLKNKKGTERKYYKYLLRQQLKTRLKNMSFLEFFQIIIKYHIYLL